MVWIPMPHPCPTHAPLASEKETPMADDTTDAALSPDRALALAVIVSAIFAFGLGYAAGHHGGKRAGYWRCLEEMGTTE